MFLQKLTKGRNIMIMVLLVILLTIPLHSHVYHMMLYYTIVVVVLLPLAFYRIIRSESLEKRFYYRWGKRRKKGRLANMFIEGLRFIFLMVAIVFGSQFIVNGYTPRFILGELSINVSIGLMLLFLIPGAIFGIIAWYESEKRYEAIMLIEKTKKLDEQPTE